MPPSPPWTRASCGPTTSEVQALRLPAVPPADDAQKLGAPTLGEKEVLEPANLI